MTWITVKAKNLLSRFIIIDGYCKKCGKTMNNPSFSVEDNIWNKICADNPYKHLCLKCFIKKAFTQGVNIITFTVHGWYGQKVDLPPEIHISQ